MKSIRQNLLFTLLTYAVYLALACGQAAAQDWYVATTGDNSNDGKTIGTPLRNITAAVDSASPGETIAVAAGAYGEAVTIDMAVTLTGTGSPTTTSFALNAGAVVTGSSGISAATIYVNDESVLLSNGVLLAATGGTVNVINGDFTGEDITVAKSLTITGGGTSNVTKFILTAANVTITGCPVNTIDVSGAGDIQDAVDAISASGTINVAAGAYGEAVTIDMAVTLTGTGSPTTTSFALNAGAVVTGSAGISAGIVSVNDAGVLLSDGVLLASAGGTVNVINGDFTGEDITVAKSLTITGGGASNVDKFILTAANVTITGSPVNTIDVTSPGEIQDAVDVISSGGTINVTNATYSETVTIGKSLTISGAGAANVTKFILTAASITISGCPVNTVDVSGAGDIQDAADAISSGGTIAVAAGAYGEAVTIAKTVTLTGTGSPTTTSFAFNAGAVVTGSSGISAGIVSVNDAGVLLSDGVLLASAGGTVNVVNGDFTGEDITVAKSLTITGGGASNVTKFILTAANITITGCPVNTIDVTSPGEIQDAVDAISSGGTIAVAAGTYGEAVTIAKTVTLTGTGSPTTTSFAFNAGAVVTGSSGISAATINVNDAGVLLSDGVLLASAGGTVNVVNGDFTGEDITVAKSLTITGGGTSNVTKFILTAANVTITGCPVNTIDVTSPGEIQDAVDAISSGGTINVTNATYSETVTIGKSLTISGAGAANVTKFILTAASITISGCPVNTIDVSGAGEIQDAVDAISSGGTINVTAGTYAETLTINKAVTLTGKKVDGTTDAWTASAAGFNSGPQVDWASGSDLMTISANNVSIRGFQFDVTSNGSATGGIVFGGSQSNVTLEYNTFVLNGTDKAIRTGATSISTILVNYNDFDGTADGDGDNEWFSVNGGAASGITLSNNHIQDSKSILELGGTGNIASVAYSDNTFDNGNGYILLSENAGTDKFATISITGNSFNNITRANKYAVAVAANVELNTDVVTGWSTDLVVTNNDFNQSTASSDMYLGFIDAVTTTPTTNITARDNWWSSADGPDHRSNVYNVFTRGDSISSYVDYVPWLDAQGGSSFAPIINNDSPPDSFGTFTSAIAGTNSGGTISARPGIYTESFTVTKQLTFRGVKSDGVTSAFDTLSQGSDEGTIIKYDSLTTSPTALVTISANNVILRGLVFDIADSTTTTAVVLNAVSGTTLEYNTFQMDTYVNTGILVDNGSVTSLRLYWNDFIGPVNSSAKWLKTGTSGALSDAVFQFNTTYGANSALELGSVGNIADVSYKNNVFENGSGYILLDEPSDQSTYKFDDILVFNNEFHDASFTNQYAVKVSSDIENSDAADSWRDDLQLKYNDFVLERILNGFTVVGFDDPSLYSTPIDAEENWWGDVSGPFNQFTNSGAAGTVVSDSVDYEPVLDFFFPALAPPAPQELDATTNSVKVDLEWGVNPAPDFKEFKVHRSTDQDFTPDGTTLIATVPKGTYTYEDTDPALSLGGTLYYYRVLAADSTSLESIPSNVDSAGLKLASYSNITTKEGKKITINVGASYTGNYGLRYSLSSALLDDGSAVYESETKRFLWTPDFSQSGIHTLQINVTDGIISDSRSISFNIQNVNFAAEGASVPDSAEINYLMGGSIGVDSTGIYTLHKVDIPAGALAASKTIIVRPPSIIEIPEETLEEVPSAVSFEVRGYESGFDFLDSVTITVEYKDFEIADGDEDQLRLHFWDSALGIWKRILSPHAFDFGANTVSAKVTHFTVFSVISIANRFSSVSDGAGWHMVSLPVEPQAPADPRSLFDAYIRPFNLISRNSSIYRYDEPTASWVIPDTVRHGTGYLLYFFEESTVEITGLEVTGNVSKILTFTNNGGWHILGNPFIVDIDWDTDIDLGSGIGSTFYRWVDNEYKFYPGGGLTNIIEPWDGFWVRTTTDSAEIVINYPGSTPKRAARRPAVTWRIQIEAESGSLHDTHNYIGIGENASHGYDDADVYELTSLDRNYISAYFPHQDWDLFAGNFTQDIRPSEGGELSWNLTVETHGGLESSTLNWMLPMNFDDSYAVTLTDTEKGNSVDMRAAGEYTFKNEPERTEPEEDGVSYHYFTVTLSEGKTEEKKFIPDTYYIRQNYPNPFNAGTIIEYGLPEHAKVTITIYNMLGQVVKKLVDENMDAGAYKATWNGTNAKGTSVGSGVYMYRIKAGTYETAKKLILLK
ncbi:T9SS type A sorting domain-containing protein [candidate division KSB1 bacterium]